MRCDVGPETAVALTLVSASFFTSHNDNCGELHVEGDNIAGVSLTHSMKTTIMKVDLRDQLKPLHQIAPGRTAIVVILSYYPQCCYFLQCVRAVS